MERKLIPMIAIPTTSGTGSEATHFAVLFKGDSKYSIVDENLIPQTVILAPELTTSMPRMVAITTGFDSFSQAIESFWSVNSTEESREYSLQAISIIQKSFVSSVNNNRIEDRANMQKAAFLSGKAINIAKTTSAHAISYPLTSFFKIPHGLAVFLTIPTIFKFNMDISQDNCSDPRGYEFVSKRMTELKDVILRKNNGNNPKEVLLDYLKTFAMKFKLSDYGVKTDSDISTILNNGFNPQRMKNNPRKMTRDDLRKILQEI